MGGAASILWYSVTEHLIMTDSVLIYSTTVTGVALDGIDNSVFNFLNDTYMIG
jgi:hypothetical protein